MSYPIATRERAGLMSPELVEQTAQAYGSISALPPIGAILDYKGVLPTLGWRWMAVDRAVLTIASYPDLFAVLGRRFFLPGPTLTNIPPDSATDTPTSFAVANNRLYHGTSGGAGVGLYEIDGGYGGSYARPGAAVADMLNHPSGKLNQMAFMGGVYAALRYTTSAGQQVYTSADGTTFAAGSGIGAAASPMAIAAGAGIWLALMSSANIHTNANANPNGGWGSYANPFTGVPADLVFDSVTNLFVAVCSNGYIYTSPTGLNGSWTQRLATTLSADSFQHTRRYGTYLYAWTGNASGGNLWRSADAITWASVRPAGIANIHHIWYDGTRLHLLDATNGIVYASIDHLASVYPMAASLFPFTFSTTVRPLGAPGGHVLIGKPNGITTISAMKAIYSYGTQFALPPSDAGKTQIIRAM